MWEKERAGGGRKGGREGVLAHSLIHTFPALPLLPTLHRGEDMEEGLPAQIGKDRQMLGRTERANGRRRNASKTGRQSKAVNCCEKDEQCLAVLLACLCPGLHLQELSSEGSGVPIAYGDM